MDTGVEEMKLLANGLTFSTCWLIWWHVRLTHAKETTACRANSPTTEDYHALPANSDLASVWPIMLNHTDAFNFCDSGYRPCVEPRRNEDTV